MLTGLHFLLSYRCNYECDHCFLFCGPNVEGTFKLEEVERALDQGVEAGITSIYVEGGEPFLFYPLMLETLRLAEKRGLARGLVTNCYWSSSLRDAELWLRPIAEIGLDDFSVSDDTFHGESEGPTPASFAARAAEKLGLPSTTICIEAPSVDPTSQKSAEGAVIGGDVLFKGRAAETLTEGLPHRSYRVFDSCPHEELESPGRLHLDPFGNVFVCQGISIGNIWKKPLKQIMDEYKPREHPLLGRLIGGGPAELANAYGLDGEETAVDHCHLCFKVRKRLLQHYPECLCPPSVYGL